MAQRKRGSDDGRALDPEEPSLKFKLAALGIVALVVGLGLAIGSMLYKWQLVEKVERVRAEGRPVSATVTGFREIESGRGAGVNSFEISYEYGGRSYRARVKCGVAAGCDRDPGPEITIWVDPEHPEDFATHDGNTDAVVVINLWTAVPFSLLIAAVGAFLLFVALKGEADRRGAEPKRRRLGSPGRTRGRK